MKNLIKATLFIGSRRTMLLVYALMWSVGLIYSEQLRVETAVKENSRVEEAFRNPEQHGPSTCNFADEAAQLECYTNELADLALYFSEGRSEIFEAYTPIDTVSYLPVLITADELNDASRAIRDLQLWDITHGGYSMPETKKEGLINTINELYLLHEESNKLIASLINATKLPLPIMFWLVFFVMNRLVNRELNEQHKGIKERYMKELKSIIP